MAVPSGNPGRAVTVGRTRHPAGCDDARTAGAAEPKRVSGTAMAGSPSVITPSPEQS
jgi:hypothetical protein